MSGLKGYDAWKTDSGERDLTDQEIEIDRLETRVNEMEAALQECAEYFDQRSDIANEHDEDGSPRPNLEMRLLSLIEDVL